MSLIEELSALLYITDRSLAFASLLLKSDLCVESDIMQHLSLFTVIE